MDIEELKRSEIRPKGDPGEDEDPWTNVSKDNRTSGKDKCANSILNQIVNEDKWGMDVIEIAEEVEWSRQHTRTVIREYFEPVPEDEAEDTADEGEQNQPFRFTPLDIEIPADVENREDYLLGIIYGLVMSDGRWE